MKRFLCEFIYIIAYLAKVTQTVVIIVESKAPIEVI